MPDPSFVFPLILQSALVPFGLALAVLLALRPTRLSAAAPAIALAIGFVASYFASLHAQWSLVPHQALDWLPWIALFGALGALAVDAARHTGVRLLARLALSLLAAAVVVLPALAGIGPQKAALTIIVAGGLICAAWTYLARAAGTRPTPPLLLAVIAGGAGLALMLDSSQAIGQLSGALASALIACIAFNLPRVRSAFSGAAAGVAVLLLGTLLVSAYLYAEFSLVYVALLVGGLLADPIVEGVNRLRKRSSGIGSWLTAAVLTAIPVLATIGLAVKAMQAAGGY